MKKKHKKARSLRTNQGRGHKAIVTKVNRDTSLIDLKNHISTCIQNLGGKLDGTSIVLDYIENVDGWSKPQKTEGYAMSCSSKKYSGAVSQENFKSNYVLNHWSLGNLRVAIYHPYVYPGMRRIFFPFSYATEDNKVYTEITFFHTQNEPSQQDADNLYLCIFAYLSLESGIIREEPGWNTSFLLRPIMDALALQVHQRETQRLQNKLNTHLKLTNHAS